jgi:helicase MOV-10
MTRARALLIVVGDPTVLSLDPLWRSWLNFVYLRGGWTGATPGPTWDARAEVREGGAYDRELQELGLQEMRELTTRIRASNTVGTNTTIDGLGDLDGDDAAVRSWEVDAREAE